VYQLECFEEGQDVNNEHIELSKRALVWISNKATRKGIRGAREVAIPGFYVADALCLCSLQYRFFESYTSYAEYKVNYFACVFQAKVSRSDYLKDFNKNKDLKTTETPCSLHWVVTTKSLVNISELPENWGLLEECGAGLSERKKPNLNKIPICSFEKIAEQILWAIGKTRIEANP